MNEVYRQERLASYIFIYESQYLTNAAENKDNIKGWQHYIKQGEKMFNKPSRYYYYICLGLFFVVPVVVYAYGVIYMFLNSTIYLRAFDVLCGVGGLVEYALFVFFSIRYIKKVIYFNSNRLKKTERI